ncbi:MAG: TlpA family protein disulfide reductase [Opitutales bacterium]
MRLSVQRRLFSALLALSLGLWSHSLTAQVQRSNEGLVAAFNALLVADTLTDEVLQAGRDAGLKELNLFEARALRTLRGSDSFAGILEAYEATDADFSLLESMVFGTEMEWQGMGHLLRARQAQLDDDTAAFERHSKEAFWLAPDYAPLLMQWISDYRLDAAMAELQLPMDLELARVDGEPVTLAQLADGQKALLIDFWASWCVPCLQKLPALKQQAARFAPENVKVVSINVQDLADAQRIYDEETIEHPWLVEPMAQPYVRALQVDSLPRMVLITPQGRILFNGFPSDPALEAALLELGVSLTGPVKPGPATAATDN